MAEDGALLVRVGAYDYEVISDTTIAREGLLGEIDTVEHCIRVLPTLNPMALKHVLYHEVIHGILSHAGIMEHDELVIDAIANGLVQVFRDNPWLVEMERQDGEV